MGLVGCFGVAFAVLRVFPILFSLSLVPVFCCFNMGFFWFVWCFELFQYGFERLKIWGLNRVFWFFGFGLRA